MIKKLSLRVIYVLILFIGISVYRNYLSQPELPESVAKTFKQYLVQNYNKNFPSLKLQEEDIVFSHLRVRGMYSTLNAKVTISVKGIMPPDGVDVRYFRYHQPWWFGTPYFWNEITELSYKTTLISR